MSYDTALTVVDAPGDPPDSRDGSHPPPRSTSNRQIAFAGFLLFLIFTCGLFFVVDLTIRKTAPGTVVVTAAAPAPAAVTTSTAAPPSTSTSETAAAAVAALLDAVDSPQCPVYERVFVVSRYKEDVSWLGDYFPDVPRVVYTRATPYRDTVSLALGSLTLPRHNIFPNVGNEATSFLRFIIEHYNRLPDTTVFMHGHRYGWHLDGDMVTILDRFYWKRYEYMSLNVFRPDRPDSYPPDFNASEPLAPPLPGSPAYRAPPIRTTRLTVDTGAGTGTGSDPAAGGIPITHFPTPMRSAVASSRATARRTLHASQLTPPPTTGAAAGAEDEPAPEAEPQPVTPSAPAVSPTLVVPITEDEPPPSPNDAATPVADSDGTGVASSAARTGQTRPVLPFQPPDKLRAINNKPISTTEPNPNRRIIKPPPVKKRRELHTWQRVSATDIRPSSSQSSTWDVLTGKWDELFRPELGERPLEFSQYCCAQFAVSRRRIRARPLQFYRRLYQWITTSSDTSSVTGRVMEYLWPLIFGEPPVSEPFPNGLCEMAECAANGWGPPAPPIPTSGRIPLPPVRMANETAEVDTLRNRLTANRNDIRSNREARMRAGAACIGVDADI